MKTTKNKKQKWFDIFSKLKGFEINQKVIDDAMGDLEVGSEVELMQNLIDNYNPPTPKS